VVCVCVCLCVTRSACHSGGRVGEDIISIVLFSTRRSFLTDALRLCLAVVFAANICGRQIGYRFCWPVDVSDPAGKERGGEAAGVRAETTAAVQREWRCHLGRTVSPLPWKMITIYVGWWPAIWFIRQRRVPVGL